jgi:hypothetical protein
MEEVVEYQVKRISLAQSHHLQPLLLVGGVDHFAAIYKIQLINSLPSIFDPLPSLDAPSPCIKFENPRSSVISLVAVRAIPSESTAPPVAQPGAVGFVAILLRFFWWPKSAKVIHMIVPTA